MVYESETRCKLQILSPSWLVFNLHLNYFHGRVSQVFHHDSRATTKKRETDVGWRKGGEMCLPFYVNTFLMLSASPLYFPSYYSRYALLHPARAASLSHFLLLPLPLCFLALPHNDLSFDRRTSQCSPNLLLPPTTLLQTMHEALKIGREAVCIAVRKSEEWEGKMGRESEESKAECSRHIGIHGVYHWPNNDANHNVHAGRSSGSSHLSSVSEKMRPEHMTSFVLWGNHKDMKVFTFSPLCTKTKQNWIIK